jgi:hypothetical protein
MVHERQIRDTLTAVEMDVGDELRFVAGDGRARSIVLRETGASVDHTTLKQLGEPEPGAMTRFRFHAVFEIDGQRLTLEREAPTARSFYEPTEVAGLWLWLDAVDQAVGPEGGDGGDGGEVVDVRCATRFPPGPRWGGEPTQCPSSWRLRGLAALVIRPGPLRTRQSRGGESAIRNRQPAMHHPPDPHIAHRTSNMPRSPRLSSACPGGGRPNAAVVRTGGAGLG